MPARVLVFGALVVMFTVSTAAAQAQPGASPAAPAPQPSASTITAVPTFEIGLGYQWLRAGELCADDTDAICDSSRTFPLGFAIDGVRNFGALGLVAELGWSRDAEDLLSGTDDVTVSDNIFHYAAGLRLTGHHAGPVWPYGQILIGGATLRSSVDFDNDALDDTLGGSETTTRFMVQPGVGLTIVGGDGWGVFGQVDYRRLFLDEDEDGGSGRNDVRVFAGLRVILD